MSGMAPEVDWGFSAHQRMQEMADRMADLERRTRPEAITAEVIRQLKAERLIAPAEPPEVTEEMVMAMIDFMLIRFEHTVSRG